MHSIAHVEHIHTQKYTHAILFQSLPLTHAFRALSHLIERVFISRHARRHTRTLFLPRLFSQICVCGQVRTVVYLKRKQIHD